MRTLVALIVLIIFSPVAVQAQTPTAATPEASPTREPLHESCYDLGTYQEQVQQIYRELDAEHREALRELADMDIDEMRPSQLQTLSIAFDRLATGMERMPEDGVPYAVQWHHETMTDVLGIYASILNAVLTGGPLGAMAYTDAYEAATSEMARADVFGQGLCFHLWNDTIGEALFN